MKAIMVMFDSLNRRMLPPYGCDWVHAPNFTRLAEQTVTFDNAYGGSVPCMPARRELHTGRYNFLHRSWGPLEPFDDSMPEILKNHGIATHLVSDHYHYWEEGGANYHTRYSTWQASRGQEGDPWKALLNSPPLPETLNDTTRPAVRQDWINRQYMTNADDLPQAKTFTEGLAFLRENHDSDNWFLHIETFDPHEPFFSHPKYKRLYDDSEDAGPLFDWPAYGHVRETPEQIEQCRREYAAVVSMCDDHLGRVLDAMDQFALWDDTMLIVNTDHGFLLGERGWWGKTIQPYYDEVIHLPLFVWDPRCGCRGQRRASLVQTIDLAPTLLDFFSLPPTADMLGKNLAETVRSDCPVREACLFGVHGGHVNCTDGRYVYMRAPARAENAPLYEYTLMPVHPKHAFSVDELRDLEIHAPFGFTRGCRVLKIPKHGGQSNAHSFGTLLFDLANDPRQEQPLNNSRVEAKMVAHMMDLMHEHDAPPEQFIRLGLDTR